MPLFNLSVGVRVRVCHIIPFTDCESCARPISANPVSMEAGEYGLTRGTCFFVLRLEMVAVAELMWVSRCVFDEAGFFRAFHEFAFSNS